MGYRGVRRVGGSGDIGLDILCFDECGGRVAFNVSSIFRAGGLLLGRLGSLLGLYRFMDASRGSLHHLYSHG